MTELMVKVAFIGIGNSLFSMNFIKLIFFSKLLLIKLVYVYLEQFGSLWVECRCLDIL